MDKTINLGNLVIPIIKPEKGIDYYTEAEKQELIEQVTNNVNEVVLPQEETRQNNEEIRQNNEATRQAQEVIRQTNENNRQTAETNRITAETTRQSNEGSRESAEQTRIQTFNSQMQAVNTAIAGIHTSQDAYDQNAQAKTTAFNENATNKTEEYNANATTKIEEYDDHVHDYEQELANKVDKVAGKGLSTNDYDNTEQGKVTANTEARHTHSNKAVLDATTASYTTEEKTKLAELENYDDTDIVEEIEALQAENAELKEQVEDLENNQLEATATGETIYITDSASAKNRGIGITGNKEQYSTTGKNLYRIIGQTNGGITGSLEDNGYLKVFGTSTGGYANVTGDFVKTLPIGTYIFSITQAQSFRVAIRLNFTDSTSISRSIAIGSTSLSITAEKEVSLCRAYIEGFSSGTTIDSSFGIMLSTEGGEWEPYTGRKSFTISIISTNNI